MAVPFIDLKRFEPGFLDRWNTRVSEMSARAEFIGGPMVSKLETRLQEYTGVEEVVTCANGTDAIQLALRAIGVGVGDVILVPELTFWATYEAVVNVGASPYTVDCRRDDQSIDIDRVRDLLSTVKPKAVIAVHLYGWGSGHLAALRDLCERAEVPLVEDAAQAFGVQYRDEPIMKNAHIATTSFYPAKVLGGAGDGGAVFCNDRELADTVRCLTNHGRVAHYGHGAVGWNSRMDALQSAYLDLCLDHFDQRLSSRRAMAEAYRQQLADRFDGLAVVNAPGDYRENGYCNVCLVESAEIKQVLELALKEKKIGFANIYPAPMSAQPGALPYLKGHASGDTAAWLCSHVLNLPLFPYMREDELVEVITTVTDVMHAQGK